MIHARLAGKPIAIHVGEGSPPCGQLGFDVETTAIRPLAQWDPSFVMKLCQFGTREEAWVFDMADADQVEIVREILTDARYTFCSHTNYDALSVAVVLGIDVTDRLTDTHLLASEVLQDPSDARDLKSLTTKHVGPELQEAEDALHARFHALWEPPSAKAHHAKASLELGWENYAIGNIPLDETYLRYSALDSVACLHVLDHFMAHSQPPAIIDLDQRLAARANRMQIRGWLVDTEAVAQASEVVEAAHEQIQHEAQQLTDGIKVNSSKLAGWMLGHGLTRDRWIALGGGLTPHGAISLGRDSLPAMENITLSEKGRAVMDLRIQFSETSDYATKLKTIMRLTADDGRVHTPIKTLGAVRSSRMSSTGVNLLALSPEIRKFFYAEPGMVLVTADLSNIEIRVAAAGSQDPALLAAFARGDDLHQKTADRLGVDRKVAKTLNLALGYGGGVPAVVRSLGVDRTTATSLIRGVKQLYPQLYRTVDRFSRYPRMKTFTGRRLKGIGRNNWNHWCQAVARDYLVEAWDRFCDDWPTPDPVYLPIHDELVAQVQEHEAEQALEALIAAMTGTLRGVPIAATGVVLGNRWIKPEEKK